MSFLQICDHGKGAAHLDTLESEGRDYSFQSFDTSCRALQCKNNTLQAVPTIIITSGSSSSNANASEPKSTLNQPLDSFGIAGKRIDTILECSSRVSVLPFLWNV